MPEVVVTSDAADERKPGESPTAGAGFWAVAGVYALAMLGGTLPIPLYSFWGSSLHFGAFTTTLLFAVYAVGTALALVFLGSLSDRVGRRPVLFAAVLTAAASTALFLVAGNVGALLVARLLSGLATGMATASATAALDELAGPERARHVPVVSTVANMGGLGLGVVTAGVFARFVPSPTHAVFWVYLAALVPALLAIALTHETSGERGGPVLSVRRPTLPPDPSDRRRFLGAAALVLAAFAVTGLFSSLVPSFLGRLGVSDPALVGAEVALLFAVALVVQVADSTRWLRGPRAAPGVLITGVVVFEGGVLTGSLPAFLAGTLLCGAGFGLAFRRGLALTQRLADPRRRADLLATYFLAAYTGSIVPTVALGALTQVIAPNIAALCLGVAVIAATTAASSLNPRRTQTAPESP